MENTEAHIAYVVDTYRELPNVEIEVRFGVHHGNFFDTDISEKNYETIQKAFENYKDWESIEEIDSNDYFSNGMRLSIDTNGNTECIRKNNLLKENWTIIGSPIDFRISVSEEIKVDQESFDNSKIKHMRNKTRKRFRTQNYIFDLTIVEQNPQDDDDDSNETYELEIELNLISLNNVDVSSTTIAKSIIHKIHNILRIIDDKEYSECEHRHLFIKMN